MKVSIASAASTTFLNTKANDKKTAFNIELFYCHFTYGKCWRNLMCDEEIHCKMISRENSFKNTNFKLSL